MQKHHIPVDEALIRHSNFSDEDVAAHTHSLLDLPVPLDTLFAINDAAAIQAMLLVKKRGTKIPEEVAVVGFNNSPESVIIAPALTTVEQPSYNIGQKAANHILGQIKEPDNFSP